MSAALQKYATEAAGYGCLSRRPRVKGTRTRDIPRTPRSCIILPQGATRQAEPLVRKAIFHLGDSTGPMAFSESEQSKNEVGGMVPLRCARAGPGA